MIVLRPYQEQCVESIFREWEEHTSTLAVMATGTGKCFAAGTPIMLSDGSIKPVELIQIGDQLMGWDSHPRKVTSTCFGMDNLFSVTPVKGCAYTVNSRHVLSLKITNIGKKKVSILGRTYSAGDIANVSVGDYIESSRNFRHVAKGWRMGVSNFANEGVPHPNMPPYMLGIWLGDGSKDSYTIHKPDTEIRDSVKRFASEIGARFLEDYRKPSCPSLRIRSQVKWERDGEPALRALRDIGVYRNKHIPRQYLCSSAENRSQLLAGLLDTDGSLTDGGYDFISVIQSISEGVAFLARSLGLAAYVLPCQKSCQTGAVGSYWRVSISGDCSSLPLRIARKKSLARKQIKSVLRTGITIQPIGFGMYYGFELAGPDRMFLLGDFTVAHNSKVFTEVVRRTLPKRAIIVAHRAELIHQATNHLRQAGIETEIEMAGYKSNHSMFDRKTAIVASVQTLISGIEEKRMEKFRPEDFGLLVVDETHHIVSDSYRAVCAHFQKNKDIKILGVTATPDRADEEALGQIFQSVAFEYEINDGIRDGWLCDIEQQVVHIKGLDYSTCRTTAGDLNGADLAQIMEDEHNLQGMAGATLDLIGTSKKTLVFTASVRQAEQCNNIFNRHNPGSSTWVHGAMAEDERNRNIRDFRSNRVQVLVNCSIATEGFDVPDIEVVVLGKPTKSRALFSQMIGRGTRPLPHTVDGLDSPEERRAAIAASAKPRTIILDFAGNSGRHKLISCADVLGGKYSDEVVELAKREASKGGGKTVTESLEDAQEEVHAKIEQAKRDEEARRARLVAKVQFSVQRINPFDAFDLAPVKERGWDRDKNLSEKQQGILLKIGVDPTKIGYAQGKQLVAEACRRWREHLCTAKQANLLKKHGYQTKDMTMKEASATIDALAKNGWRRPAMEVAA